MFSGGIERNHKHWIGLTTSEITELQVFWNVLQVKYTYSGASSAHNNSKRSAIFRSNEQTTILDYFINKVQEKQQNILCLNFILLRKDRCNVILKLWSIEGIFNDAYLIFINWSCETVSWLKLFFGKKVTNWVTTDGKIFYRWKRYSTNHSPYNFFTNKIIQQKLEKVIFTKIMWRFTLIKNFSLLNLTCRSSYLVIRIYKGIKNLFFWTILPRKTKFELTRLKVL